MVLSLGEIKPKGNEYFWYCFGFGSWFIPPQATDKTEAYEVQVCFEARCNVYMTFRARHQVNLTQFTGGKLSVNVVVG